MDQSTIAQRFDELGKGAERSITAKFRDVFDHIERALNAGVSRGQARDELAAFGLDMSQNTFNTLLKRVRKERRATPVILAPVSPPPPRPAVASNGGKPPGLSSEPVALPEDWRTGPLTPAQAKLMTYQQNQERRAARDKLFHPSTYDRLPKPNN